MSTENSTSAFLCLGASVKLRYLHKLIHEGGDRGEQGESRALKLGLVLDIIHCVVKNCNLNMFHVFSTFQDKTFSSVTTNYRNSSNRSLQRRQQRCNRSACIRKETKLISINMQNSFIRKTVEFQFLDVSGHKQNLKLN